MNPTIRAALHQAIGRLETLLARHAEYQEDLADLQRFLCTLAIRIDTVVLPPSKEGNR